MTTVIICGQKTCQLGLCSHVNDIVPLSYRSDFWNEIVDCVTQIRFNIVPVLGQHLEMGRVKAKVFHRERRF